MTPKNQKERADFLSRNLIPIEHIEADNIRPYLVKGWIDRGAFSVIYGESNVGKTFLALDMAMHVAAGEDWHGNRVTGGTVVYVASEGGRGIWHRVEAIWKARRTLAERAKNQCLMLPVPLDMHGSLDRVAIVQTLLALPERPSLVVIDTLARSMGTGDENASADMGAFIAAVDDIRTKTGAHVSVIHHAGKDATRGARGHSSLRAAVDTEIELKRDGKIITAETRKQRDMEGGKVFAYSLQVVPLGEDQDGDPITSCVVTPCDTPPKRGPKITGQANIALQALSDAIAHHGEKRGGDMFPANRQVVSLDRWREYCKRHKLSVSDKPEAFYTAFSRAVGKLQEVEAVKVIDDCAWITAA